MLSLFQHEFVLNALLAGTIVAIVCGLIGYFVVLRGQTFAADALSHIGFAGATAAVILGATSLVGMLLFTLLSAAGMGALGKRLRGRDVEIGMVLSFILGLGVLFLNLYTRNTTRAVGVLFGSILSVTRQDVVISLIGGLVVTAVLAGIYRPLLFASVDPEVAEARGIRVSWLSLAFLILLAVTVAEAVQVVGVLLVFALLVVPAAAAEHLTHAPARAILLGVGVSLLSTWGGLALAFIGHWPASFYIVAITSVFYFASRVYFHIRVPRAYHALPHPSRELLPPE